MRIAALLILILAAFLFCVSTAFKFAAWPGGSIGLMLATILYILVYTPLYLAFTLRNETLQPIRNNLITGSIGSAAVLTGLLFFNLHWDSALLMLIVGGLAGITALVLFFKNQKDHAGLFKSYRTFRIMTLILILLSAACTIPTIRKNNRMEEHLQFYISVKEDHTKAGDELKEIVKNIDLEDSTQVALFEDSKANANVDLIIFMIQREIMSMESGYAINNLDEIDPETIHWDNYDLPTYFLVGDDPNNPRGKGKEILSELQGLKSNLHARGIELNISLPANNEENTKWINDHFYRKDIAETMAFLYTLRTELAKQLCAEMKKNIAPKS